MGGPCNTKGGEEKRVYITGIGKPEGKRLLGRSRSSCEDNINMDLGETGIWGGYSLGLVWLRIGNSGGLL
jgi:hypothetical protein